MTTPDQVLAHLSRTTDQIFGREDLKSRLASGRRLRIKFGVDCTAPDLHLGHAVNLWMMRYLQDLGHVVVFLLGDTTTRIGDPTCRSTTRPMLTQEQIEQNAQAFLAQVTLVLRGDGDVLEVRRNSEWYDTMAITDLIGELSLVTHRQLMSRDMFQNRLQEHREIAMHELIYPVLQGFDSVALESDLTIVGSDQLFNETMGRELQSKHGQLPQTVVTSTITPGLDGGPKQSKSLNNYVGLAHDDDEKFGRLMTLNDDLIGVWARVYTDLPIATVDGLHRRARIGGTGTRDAKLELAEAIVARYHGTSEAGRAREAFLSVFSDRKLPRDHARTADCRPEPYDPRAGECCTARAHPVGRPSAHHSRRRTNQRCTATRPPGSTRAARGRCPADRQASMVPPDEGRRDWEIPDVRQGPGGWGRGNRQVGAHTTEQTPEHDQARTPLRQSPLGP